MSGTTLAAGAAFAFVAAAVYAYVGFRVSKRRVSPDAQLAAKLFALWWLALGGTTALGGIQTGLAAAGMTSLSAHLAVLFVNLLLICVGLLGLLYYLVYLFTGRRRAIYPLAGFYVAYFALLLYVIVDANPIGIDVGRWSVSAAYETPLQGPLVTVIILLLVMPQFLGALAYLSLYFRVKERTQRYRILLVGGSIVVWFGSVLAASQTGLSQNDSWQVASRGIGLAAAIAVLLAYEPPGFVRRRLGITSVREDGAAARRAEERTSPAGPAGRGVVVAPGSVVVRPWASWAAWRGRERAGL